PNLFIPLSEETGLIEEIGAFSLRRACQDAARWAGRHGSELRVAVNVSARQLYSPRFMNRVRRILDETGLDPTLLELEVTESSLAHDVEACRQVLSELAKLGISLALDDFGTGYSALCYLQKFNFNVLKLDQSFVRRMGFGGNSGV